MFSSITIGILVALSAGAWVYSQMMRRTGNNTKNSVVSACIAGVFAFIIIVTILSIIDSHLSS